MSTTSANTGIPITLLEWRSHISNSLRGFASVRIGRSLMIDDCPVLSANGRTWATLPSKPVVGRDGTVKKDARGKTAYVPMMRWGDKEAADRFSAAVVEAVLAAHPAALSDAAPR